MMRCVSRAVDGGNGYYLLFMIVTVTILKMKSGEPRAGFLETDYYVSKTCFL